VRQTLRAAKYGAAFALALSGTPGDAQDLEPRSLASAPVGMNFALLAYGYSSGNVLLDPALPVEDASAQLNIISGAYVRAIDFFGLSGKLDVIAPFTWGTWEGKLEGRDTSVARTGFGDPRVRLSVNFVGAPALRGGDFIAYRQGTVVGASLQVRLPLGEYNPAKLINLGSNRWTFRTQLGVSQRAGSWVFESYLAAWFFTKNTDFRGGSTLSQEAVLAIKGHVAYTFRSGVWVALDAGFGTGGATTVDDAEEGDLQENFRFGATLAIPLAMHHALKLAAVRGVTTRIGADFDSIVLAYQYRWGGLPTRPR
jgi:hypothetical protein